MTKENDKNHWDIGVTELKTEPETARNPYTAATHQKVVLIKGMRSQGT
jgi:hypothetical protein